VLGLQVVMSLLVNDVYQRLRRPVVPDAGKASARLSPPGSMRWPSPLKRPVSECVGLLPVAPKRNIFITALRCS